MIDTEDQSTIRTTAEAPNEPVYVTDLAQDSADFEPIRNPNKPMKWVVFLIVLFVLILGAVLILRTIVTTVNKEPVSTPTPIMFISPAPTLTPTPDIVVDKKQFKIKVFNGTGIAGEAKYLKDKLLEIGFETVDTGNAPTSDYEIAQLYAKESIPKELTNEVLRNMKLWFSDALVATKIPSGQYDIEIVTGFRPGVSRPTAKPTVKPTVSNQASPTPPVTQSPTSTNSPSPSPSPSTTPSV